MKTVKVEGGTISDGASEHRVGGIIRALRAGKDLSVRTLAARSGFSPSFLSQVEHGQASPSIASLEKIAAALGVTLSEFFAREPGVPEAPSLTIVRAGDRPEITSGWSRGTLAALGPTAPGQALEPVMLTLEPDGRTGARPAGSEGQEFAIVWDGAVRLTLGDTAHALAAGDAVTFTSATPHGWENVGPTRARILFVGIRPVR